MVMTVKREFEIGDVVFLKSGSPALTVICWHEEPEIDGESICEDGEGKPCVDLVWFYEGIYNIMANCHLPCLTKEDTRKLLI